jgi:hypothetical protein
MARVDLEAEIDALSGMDLEALRDLWRTRFNADPPKLSAGLLRLALARIIHEPSRQGFADPV